MAKANGKTKGNGAEVKTYVLAILPVPVGDFRRAEAEAWIDEQLIGYQLLMIDAPELASVATYDVVTMVRGCVEAMRGATVRFEREHGRDAADAADAAGRVLKAIVCTVGGGFFDVYREQVEALALAVVAMLGAEEQEQLAAWRTAQIRGPVVRDVLEVWRSMTPEDARYTHELLNSMTVEEYMSMGEDVAVRLRVIPSADERGEEPRA